MLYKEAYELIDIFLSGQETNVPLSATLKERFFGDAVKMMNRQYVRNIDEEQFEGNDSNTKYIFSNDNASDRIYQVMFKSSIDSPSYKDIPFVPQSLITNPDEVNTPSYVVRHETSKNGLWESITTSNNKLQTTVAHGLETGDYMRIYDVPSDIVGLVEANGQPKRIQVTKLDSTTVNVGSITGVTATGKKSPWQQDQVELTLSKACGSGTLTVRYYAEPHVGKTYQDVIDLPESLCKASVYCSIKELMALDGQLDVSKAMNDVSNMYQEEYVVASTTRQPQIDKLLMPLQDFV